MLNELKQKHLSKNQHHFNITKSAYVILSSFFSVLVTSDHLR